MDYNESCVLNWELKIDSLINVHFISRYYYFHFLLRLTVLQIVVLI
jgi:hypothetical protein